MEDKLVFETESIIDKESYSWVMTKFNKKNMIISRIIFAICPIYGIYLLVTFGTRMLGMAVILLAVGLLINLKTYILVPKQLAKIVESFERTGELKNEYRFYETYVERTNATGNAITKYENLSALRENDKIFAFWSEPNKVIILQKDKIDESNYDFLRSIVPADMAAVYDKKVKKKRILSSVVLGIIVVGFVAMIIMSFT